MVDRLCDVVAAEVISQLRSINLKKKIRDIIEKGPPKELVRPFDTLFSGKIERTHEAAKKAARFYDLY